MRTYDIPYVKQGAANYYPPVDYKDMDLKELTDKFLKMCAKCNGQVSVCSTCKTPCEYGRRAIQLVANEIYNDPPIPLYGGKTLIENAREENMKRRAMSEQRGQETIQENETNEETIEGTKKKKTRRVVMEGWYDKAYESPDPLKWIMDTFGITKARARNKVYSYQHLHPELRETKPLWKIDEKKSSLLRNEIENKKEKSFNEKEKAEEKETKEEKEKETNRVSKSAFDSYEDKINAMMKEQDEYKKKYEEHLGIAEEYKKKYEEVKSKIDTIFAAFNILDG